jgi:hypothetical protein
VAAASFAGHTVKPTGLSADPERLKSGSSLSFYSAVDEVPPQDRAGTSSGYFFCRERLPAIGLPWLSEDTPD